MPKLLVALVLALSLLPGCSDERTHAPTKQGELVDLNSASMSALEALPGIGDLTAKKIIAGRPYERKDQLVVRGIVTEAAYEKFRDAVIAKQ